MSALKLQFRQRRVLPIVLQDELAECGLACVVMVSHYFGHDIDLRTLRRYRPMSGAGVNMLDLKTLSEQLGFRTRALRLSLEALREIKCPVILHWNMNHFVVLKKVKKNGIIIHDPALGRRYVDFSAASESFTGIVLEIEPSDDFKAIRARDKLTLYDLAKMVTGIRWFLMVLLMLSFFIELLSLVNPLFMQYVTDDVIATADRNNLVMIASAFFLLLGLQSFVEYLRGHMGIYLSNHLAEQFSSNIVQHLLKLPLTFFEKRHKGDIQSKFQSIEQIQRKISSDFISAVLDGCFILINLMVMLIYSAFLTMIVMVSLSLFVLIRYASYHVLKKQTETSLYQHAQASSIFLETLQGILPIKSFLKESERLTTWRNANIHALNADIVLSKMQMIYRVMNQFLFHGEHLFVVCAGAMLVLSNQLSVGMLIAFLSYRLLLVNKAASLIQNIFDYQLISVQLNRLSDIVCAEPEQIQSGKGCVDTAHASITLTNLSFRYDIEGDWILKNINLEIKAGERVAIIGPSGCGKSTLLKVMMGLLMRTSGEICIDNQPMEAFGLQNYRQMTAAVMQDDALLSGSIMDNIAFFEETIDFERVQHVAQLAYIHETIKKLPMGYETRIGDMGSTLSGGQKQRLLLARALYKQPKILFLDEATSHLDVEHEKKVNQSLSQLNITQVIIAHRQETIRMADRVFDVGFN